MSVEALPPRYRLVSPLPEQVNTPELTPDQEAVVAHTGGPLLVIAGPGTGKTTTLTEAAARRIIEGTPAASVLVLTFSRRAARRMRRRIAARVDRTVATPLAFTFHGFCLAVLRRFGNRAEFGEPGISEPYGDTLRLLSGPEQEFRVRELLNGTAKDSWPNHLQPAFETRAFAAELRSVLARTRQWGMDPQDLWTVGQAAGRHEWVRTAEFFDEYLDVLDAERVMDYAELVVRTRILLDDPAVGNAVREQLCAIYVDEFQELDPSQIALLGDLVTPDTTLVAAGDPDQAVFGFRGGQGRGILDFADDFRTVGGRPAPIRTLRQDFRSAPELVMATRNLVHRLGLARAVPAEVVDALRNRQPVEAPRKPGMPKRSGRAEAYICQSPGAEADQIARLLRQARLHDGLAWTEMAVLVRSGRRSIPQLVRTLTAAGVPVEVAGDEIPLAAELAVRPLLLALEVALRGPASIDRDEAAQLLLSPLGGLDAMGLRRLGRALRHAERVQLAGDGQPRPSDELIREALADPEVSTECRELLLAEGSQAGPELERAARLAKLIGTVAGRIRDRASASEALWLLWSATGWPQRLRDQALGGGEAGRRADRDLDAVVALFGLAARAEEETGRRAVESFLAEVENQQIPADTLADDESELGGAGGDGSRAAVRVMTAHRAKGHQWPLVVVSGVQEGLWPNLRRRDTLLGIDQLTPEGVLSEPVPVAVRIAEERRLFHVACTRARQRLVVTAVSGTEGEGDQPSRFLTELGVPIHQVGERTLGQLSLSGLVAELRRTAVDPAEPTALRRAAATRLGRLAAARSESGEPLVPQADPAAWWGMHEHTDRRDDEPPSPESRISLSGSQLGSLLECPRRWFLSRRVRAERGRGAAASFGSVMHVLVQHATTSGIEPTQLVSRLGEVWHQIDYGAVWLSGVERVEAETALQRFANWQQSRTHEVVGVELPFRTEVQLAASHGQQPETVTISGTIDRLERDSFGRYHVIDFKTGRFPPRAEDVLVDPQLGLYQLAVGLGAVEGVPAGSEVAGGELVFLRVDERNRTEFAKSLGQFSVQDKPFPLDDAAPDPPDRVQPTWVHELLAEAVALIRAEEWSAQLNEGCRYCHFAASCPAQETGRQVVA